MKKTNTILGIIPARYNSTRFPGKPLAIIKDKPMIQWVYEAIENAVDYLVVATDDDRILKLVKSFGGNAILTSTKHQSGTDRCNEVLTKLEKEEKLSPDIVINIQGDEPLIKKEQVEELLSCFEDDRTQIATLVKKFDKDEDVADRNKVKVVINKERDALYFSRLPVPYQLNNDKKNSIVYLKHIGIYGYRAAVLHSICKLPPSMTELAESLEQLRWLENAYSIKTKLTEYLNIGIDTPEDLNKLSNLLDSKLG